MSDPPKLTPDELHKIYGVLLTNLAREDANTGQRVSWANALSAGMFTAIAFMAPRVNDVCNGTYWSPMICAAIGGVAAMGFFFSMRAWRGVQAAHKQIGALRDHYVWLRDQFNELHLPQPVGDSSEKWGLESATIFPRTLMVFWSIVLAAALIASVVTLSRAAVQPLAPRCVATQAIG